MSATCHIVGTILRNLFSKAVYLTMKQVRSYLKQKELEQQERKDKVFSHLLKQYMSADAIKVDANMNPEDWLILCFPRL